MITNTFINYLAFVVITSVVFLGSMGGLLYLIRLTKEDLDEYIDSKEAAEVTNEEYEDL